MFLTPTKHLKLDASSLDFKPIRGGRQFILRLSPDRFRVLNEDFTTHHEFATGIEGGVWEISPDGTLLVMVHGLVLSVLRLDGQLVYDEESTWRPGKLIDDFRFSADQRFLWTVHHEGKYNLALQVHDTTTWQVLREAVFSEPAPPASVSLHPHPEGRIMAVWAASGQDGQWVYWAYDDGQAIQVYEVPELVFATPPQFHPAGGEFLVIQGECDERLLRYRFPECEVIGALEWTDEDDDHQIGYHPVYLSDRQALLDSNNHRRFLVDLEQMRIVDELIFEGHEPRPGGADYPSLCTDLVSCDVLGAKQLWTQHRSPTDETRTVILWDADALRGPLAPIREDAPHTTRLLQQRGWRRNPAHEQ